MLLVPRARLGLLGKDQRRSVRKPLRMGRTDRDGENILGV